MERVRSQWDGTQHGVEARLQQLDGMIVHSNRWEEQRKEVKALIGHNEGRFHSLLQQSRDPLTKQLADNKVRDSLNFVSASSGCLTPVLPEVTLIQYPCFLLESYSGTSPANFSNRWKTFRPSRTFLCEELEVWTRWEMNKSPLRSITLKPNNIHTPASSIILI